MENIDRFKKINELPEEERKFARSLCNIVPNLTGIEDILGQDKDGVISVPTDQLKKNIKLMGHLLENDPEKVVSKKSIWIRKNIMHKLIIDNCEKDLHGKKHQMVKKSEINTDGPVIFMPNHISRYDATASIMAAEERLGYLVFGGLPIFYQTKTGFEAWLNGSFVINRKDPSSRKALIDKIMYGFELGLPSVIMYPEASVNKTPNKLLLDYWKGVFILSKKSGAPIVPIVHLELDDIIYSSRLEPVDFKDWDIEQATEAMEYLRELVATELYELMDKYAHTTREDFMIEAIRKYKGIDREGISYLQSKYNLSRKEVIDRIITMDEICDLMIGEKMEFCQDTYDWEIETTAHYQPKDKPDPNDVWEPIIKASGVRAEDNHIRKLIPKNYQKNY